MPWAMGQMVPDLNFVASAGAAHPHTSSLSSPSHAAEVDTHTPH